MSLELLNYRHSSFLLLGVKLPKQRIINKLAELSSEFGTEIQYSERGVGEVIL